MRPAYMHASPILHVWAVPVHSCSFSSSVPSPLHLSLTPSSPPLLPPSPQLPHTAQRYTQHEDAARPPHRYLLADKHVPVHGLRCDARDLRRIELQERVVLAGTTLLVARQTHLCHATKLREILCRHSVNGEQDLCICATSAPISVRHHLGGVDEPSSCLCRALSCNHPPSPRISSADTAAPFPRPQPGSLNRMHPLNPLQWKYLASASHKIHVECDCGNGIREHGGGAAWPRGDTATPRRGTESESSSLQPTYPT